MPKLNKAASKKQRNTPARRQVFSIGAREFDWRKASDYPPPESKDLCLWAWECLRRNREYQQAYRKFKQFGGREPSQHPIGDSALLDTYFTHPKAKKGLTLRKYQKLHSKTNTTVLLWAEYIRRLWLLKQPVDPEKEYGDDVRFVNLGRRWKKNLAKKKKSKAKKKKSKAKGSGRDREAIVVSGEGALFPFDYYTEVAPNEVLVRVRLYADDENDIALIAKSLNDRIKGFRARHRPFDYLDEIHVALRLWDFTEVSRDSPPPRRKTHAAFLTALANDSVWNASVPIAKNQDGDVGPKMPSNPKLSRLIRYATALIDGRAYGSLVAKAQRQK